MRPLVGGDDAAVRIDAIGAASAGSITGMLAARTLLEGLDPVEVMRRAWVEEDGIGKLLGRGSAAPLSIQKLRAMATSLLDPPGRRCPARQRTPIQLSFTVATLRGLDYTLPALRALQPVTATTYVDYYTAELAPDTHIDQLVAPDRASLVDAALASAANAMGFPPYLLNRTADRQRIPDPYTAVRNWPVSGSFWYTDGGTLANEPLGRTLDLTNPIDLADSDCNRLQLLVHPHPTGAPTDGAWANPAAMPTWLETLWRSMALQRTQSLYADLKQVENTNSRLAWANDLAGTVGDALDELPDVDQTALRAALTDVVARIRGQRAALRAGSTTAAAAEPADVPADATLSSLLWEAISVAANVAGKTETTVDVISPLILPEAATTSVEMLLSGEFLGHFGGFFDRRLRQADFDLGYTCTLRWLEAGGLTGAGRLDPAAAATAMQAAIAAYQPSDTWRQYGATTFWGVSTRGKLQALHLAGRIARVMATGLFTGGKQR